MAKSYKLKDDNYIDSAGIVHNGTPLSSVLQKIPEKTNGSLEVNTDYFSTVDIKNFAKYGNIIECEFRGLIASNIPNNKPIFKLPNRSLSSGTIPGFLGGRYDMQTPVWLMFSSDIDHLRCGNAMTAASGQYLHIHFVYICQ